MAPFSSLPHRIVTVVLGTLTFLSFGSLHAQMRVPSVMLLQRCAITPAVWIGSNSVRNFDRYILTRNLGIYQTGQVCKNVFDLSKLCVMRD